MAEVERAWIFTDGGHDFVFDAVIKEAHHSELMVTENPVETGVTIADHAYMMPDRLEIEAGVGEVWLRMRDPLPGTTPEELLGEPNADLPWLEAGVGEARTQRAFQLLQALQRTAEPFAVQTGLRLYENMVIRTLTAEQDKDTAKVLFFRASLSEVIRVSTETVRYPPRQNKRVGAKKAQNGEKKADAVTDPNKAKNIGKSLFGNDIGTLEGIQKAFENLANDVGNLGGVQ